MTFLFCQKIDRNNVLFDKRFDCEKMNIAIYTIFIVTYILITSRKLSILPIGRPAGALFGATLMVGVGAISPEESYMAIDHDTILLLFSSNSNFGINRIGRAFFENYSLASKKV